MVGSSNNYSRLFLFVAALALFAGLAQATEQGNGISVGLMAPANNSVGASTGIGLSWNVTGYNLTYNCSFNLSFTQNQSPFYVVSFPNTDNDTVFETFPATFVAANYTWFINCTNDSALALIDGAYSNSSGINFTVDTAGPAITNITFNASDADNYYMAYEQNALIHVNATLTDSVSNVTVAYASLIDPYNGTVANVTMDYSPVTGYWNASINVTDIVWELIANGTLTASNPFLNYTVRVQASDPANNTDSGGENNFTVYVGDLGYFQNVSSTHSTCYQLSSESTNLSSIINVSAANFTYTINTNASSACMASYGGFSANNNFWGNGSTFGKSANITFLNVNMVLAETQSAILTAVGNYINVIIPPPRSFIATRVNVSLSALNTTATVVLYNLTYNSSTLPTVAHDNGTAVSGVTLSRGDLSTEANASLSNLTFTAAGFSGYNVSDATTPYARVVIPLLNNYTNNNTVAINISINGTGSEISKVVINITKDIGYNYTYVYDNQTGLNDANCTSYEVQAWENVSCQIVTPALVDGNWTLTAAVYDYGSPSPGNYNATITYFTVDTTDPVVTINYPANAGFISGNSNASVYMIATVYDAGNSTLTCDIDINSTMNYTNLSFTNNTAQSFNIATNQLLGNGSNITRIEWSINCWDALGNNKTSGNYSFYFDSLGVAGTESDITATGFGTIGAYVDGAVIDTGTNYTGALSVNVTTDGLTVMNYSWNFSFGLNFSAISITNGTGVTLTSTDARYYVITGDNATGGLESTKTIWMYHVPVGYSSVCIKDTAASGIADMTSTCTGGSETVVLCDGALSPAGYTCTKSLNSGGATMDLSVSGLAHSVVAQFAPATGSTGSTTGGSGGSGGGAAAGGAGTPTSSTAGDYPVDIGQGKTCTVSVSREIAPATNLSVVTTTLVNKGDSGCKLTDFVFSDTIPDSFAAMNDITFSPAYASREGWTVSFSFPSFGSGESKTLTYSVKAWVAPSKVNDFTAVSLSAKKTEAAQAPTPAPGTTETPGTTEGPAATGTQPPAGSEQAPAPSPTPAAEQQGGFIGGLLSGGALLGIVLAVVVVLAAVYFLAFKGKKKGL